MILATWVIGWVCATLSGFVYLRVDDYCYRHSRDGAWPEPVLLRREHVLAAVIGGAMLSLVPNLICAYVSVWALWRKSWAKAMLRLAVFIAPTCALIGGFAGCDALPPAAVAVVAMGVWIGGCWYFERTLPDVVFLERTACGSCGYDLTGNVSGRCPECGAEIAQT